MCLVQNVIRICQYIAVLLFLFTCVDSARRRKKIQISAEVPNEEILGLPKIKHEGWIDPCFYFSMEELLEVFENSKVQFPGSTSLKSLFINKCFTSPVSWDERNADKNRRPFINIEGNHHSTRDLVAKSLSKALKGQLLLNPPRCMISVNYIYGDLTHALHRPFLALGLYGSSHSVKAYWVGKPVVMTGYWYDHTATSVINLFAPGMEPASNSTIYCFPQGLIKPDLTVFLDTQPQAQESWEDRSVKDQRNAVWQSRYTELMMTFPNANIHEIKWTTTENVTQDILHLIKSKLAKDLTLLIK